MIVIVLVMVPTGAGKPGKMGRHFRVREKSGNLSRLEMSGNFTQNTGMRKIILNTEKSTGKVGEIGYTEKVGTMIGTRITLGLCQMSLL